MATPETSLTNPKHWHCDTHGDFDAHVAVGCPECMRLARARIRLLRALLVEVYNHGEDLDLHRRIGEALGVGPDEDEARVEPEGGK